MSKTNRRSAIQIMGQLIGLVKPLLIFMIAAILLVLLVIYVRSS